MHLIIVNLSFKMHEVAHSVPYMKEHMEANVVSLAATGINFIQHKLVNSIKVNGTNISTIGILGH